MKTILFLLLTLISLTAMAQEKIKVIKSDNIDEYDKIQFRTIVDEYRAPDWEHHFGAIINKSERVQVGIFGRKKIYSGSDRYTYKSKYELLAKVEVSHVSVGATISFVPERFDDTLTINNLEGGQLKDLCGNYGGVKAGLAALFGSAGFSVINSKGIIIRSSSVDVGLNVDLSGMSLKIKCNDPKNENWKKVVRF